MSLKRNKLNKKQELFCQQFVKTFDEVKAITMAGYNKEFAKVQAKRLLEDEKIKARIKELNDEPDLIQFLDLKRLINKNIRIILADLGDFATWKGQHMDFFDSADVQTDVLSEVSKGKDGLRVKLKDYKEAQKFIMKILSHTNIANNPALNDAKNYAVSLINNMNLSDETLKSKSAVLDKVVKLLEIQQEDIDNQAQKDNLQRFLDASKVNPEELEIIKNELTKENY